ncbi:hypothetical protein ABFA07_023447 [Porites harrisoni]
MTHVYATSQPASKISTSSTFTNLAEQISRIEPPYIHDWLPYSSSEDMLSTSAPVGHHMFSASEDDEEDEDDETMVRVRPRTGSLSEHEEILALKAQAQAIIRREEAGYDSDDTHLRRRMGPLRVNTIS